MNCSRSYSLKNFLFKEIDLEVKNNSLKVFHRSYTGGMMKNEVLPEADDTL